jgi:hypothetical protein
MRKKQLFSVSAASTESIGAVSKRERGAVALRPSLAVHLSDAAYGQALPVPSVHVGDAGPEYTAYLFPTREQSV